jgi:aminomethyltransferase
LHQQQNARLVDFAGWTLPVQFEGVIAETLHTRRQVSLFDTGHMGLIEIVDLTGGTVLGGAITQNAAHLKTGRGKYGYLLNASGGVLDDTILFRLSDTRFLLVVNAATAESDLAELSGRLGHQTRTERLDTWTKFDVQGPASLDALAPHIDADLPAMRYFDIRPARIDGRDALVARTGYTGELGWELFLPADLAEPLCETLLQNPTVKPAGLGARDALRLEMGYPLYGHELDDQTTPIEAGGGCFLDLSREFVGADALRAQQSDGPSRRLIGLRTAQRRQFRPGDAILADGKPVGEITSGAFSPSLQVAIGLGFLQPPFGETGRELTVATARCEIPAVSAQPPFYTEFTCRQSL